MARGVNRVILLGNLGDNPECRYSQDGTLFARISVATDESYTDKQSGNLVPRTEWHRVTFAGKLAEIVQQYLRKGSKVYLEGRLQTRKWTDQHGADRYTTEIRANEMRMLDSRNDDQQTHTTQPQAHHNTPVQTAQQASTGFQQPPRQQPPRAQPARKAAPETVPVYNDFDEDIPF